MRILVIEDDLLIGDGIKAGLVKLGFSIDWFVNGNEGMNALNEIAYDAAVLDLNLPQIHGLDILRSWRQRGRDTPVLILTAQGALEECVEGLQQGADDYLRKPFALAELSARLQALNRRRYGKFHPVLTHANVTMHPNEHSVMLNDKVIVLKPREFKILEVFMMAPTRVFTRAQLEEKLYNWEQDVSSNAVEVHIHHLRKKLGTHFIQTVHGVGYKLGSK